MKKQFLCVLAGISTMLPALAADPASILPDESIGYLVTEGAVKWKSLAEHPVGKALPLDEIHEAYVKFLKASGTDWESELKLMGEEMGMTYDELMAKSGKSGFSLHDLRFPVDGKMETFGGEMSMAAEFDVDEAQFEKYLSGVIKSWKRSAAKLGEKKETASMAAMFEEAGKAIEESTTDYEGVKIRVYKLKEDEKYAEVPAALREIAVALSDKMMLFSTGEDGVKEMIDRQKSGKVEGSLAASEYFKGDSEVAGPSLMKGSIHLEPILELVQEYMRKEMEGGNNPAAGTPVNPLQAWAALGMDKLTSAVLTMEEGKDFIDMAGFLRFSERPGMMFLSMPEAGEAPEVLPTGLMDGSYGKIDVAKSMENLEKLLGEISPVVGAGYLMGLNQAKEMTGVDIVKDILGQMGPDLFSGSLPMSNEGLGSVRGAALSSMMVGNGVMGMKLKDAKAFDLSLQTIINKVAPGNAFLEEIEYQGFKIQKMKDLPDGMFVGYVLAGDYLLLGFGKQESLEGVLGRMRKSEGPGYFQDKVIAGALGSLRAGSVANSVSDMGAALASFFGLMELALGESQDEQSKSLLAGIKDLKEKLKLPLLLVGASWMEKGFAEVRWRAVVKGE